MTYSSKLFAILKMKLGFYKAFVKHMLNIKRNALYLKKARKKLRNKDFSIISNNCWGGSVYEDFGLDYKTPTVGLFFFAPCYLEFLNDLENNLREEMKFVDHSKYKKGNDLQKQNRYPIGLLKGSIEIHFLHYKTEAEALEKWKRRAGRVNFNNLYVSFSDSEAITNEQVKMYDQMNYKKIFFASKKIPGIQSLVFLKSYKGLPGIGNIYDERWKYRKDFNVVKWLNN